MLHISNALTIGLLLFNLTGLALAGYHFTRCYSLSKVAAPVAFVLAFFFIEHFVGLGRIAWLWPIGTAGSAWLMWKYQEVLKQSWRTEALFLLGFAYVMAWRYAYPNVDSGSERMCNLLFINNYMDGTRLPPMDKWFPPQLFNFYYSFQHYAAALIARIMGLDIGTAYNLAFSVVVGLTLTAGGAAAWHFSGRKLISGLTVVALAVGGTGAFVFVWLMWKDPTLPASVRFIGDGALGKTEGGVEADLLTGPGHWLAAFGGPKEKAVEAGCELLSYLLYLGDYHAPLGGFLLLMLALLAIALHESGQHRREASILMAATIPISIICNAWSFPQQVMLVGGWAIYRTLFPQGEKPDWRWLIAGGLGAAVLCYPHMFTYIRQSLDFGAKIARLASEERTPVLHGLMLMWPMILILFGAVVCCRSRGIGLFFFLLWIFQFALAEFIYVDDIYAGPFNRFNSTLKWWPWIWSGVLVSTAAINLSGPIRFSRYLTAGVLAVVSLYAWDLGRFVVRYSPGGNIGHLYGSAWINEDAQQKAILEHLTVLPKGLTLENMAEGAYTPGGAYALFAQQPAYMGWKAHEGLWRNYRPDVDARFNNLKQFYTGTLPNSREWLVDNNIEYIIWLKGDNALNKEGVPPENRFRLIDDQIREDYLWKEFYGVDDNFRVGFWMRRH
jgi:uncharacterized membrane protein